MAASECLRVCVWLARALSKFEWDFELADSKSFTDLTAGLRGAQWIGHPSPHYMLTASLHISPS